jgi:hypothetical protein
MSQPPTMQLVGSWSKKKEDSKVIQQPVYYFSGAKLNYSEIKKIAYTVLISSRKLKHYFQAHEITVPLAQPLGDIFNNTKASGRIGKWAIELSQFSLNYVARTKTKSQALADFMVDWMHLPQSNSQSLPQIWTLYTYGAWDIWELERPPYWSHHQACTQSTQPNLHSRLRTT